MNAPLSSDLVSMARAEADRAIAQGYHYGHPSSLVGHVRDLCNEIERLRTRVDTLIEIVANRGPRS